MWRKRALKLLDTLLLLLGCFFLIIGNIIFNKDTTQHIVVTLIIIAIITLAYIALSILEKKWNE